MTMALLSSFISFSNFPPHNLRIGNENNGDLLQKVPCMHCYTQCPQPCSRPPLTHASVKDSWTLIGKSGSVSVSVGSLILSPGSWCAQCSVCALPESVSLVLRKSWLLCRGVNGDLLQEGFCHTQVFCTQSPYLCSISLLTCTSSGNSQTQFCLSFCGVSGSW